MPKLSRAEQSQNIFSRLMRYFKALGKLGQLLTFVALLPSLVDWGARIAGTNLSIPNWAELLWLIIAFGLANFRLFESNMKSDLEIRLRRYSINLKGGWVTTDNNRIDVNFPIVIESLFWVDIYNHNSDPVDVKVSVASVESDWTRAAKKPYSDLKVIARRSNVPREMTEYNPFNIAGRGIVEALHVRFDTAVQLKIERKLLR